MAKIIIELSDNMQGMCQWHKDGICVLTNIEVGIIAEAIANGIVLPKGHGRLVDADRIITEATERMKYPANHQYMECVIAHMKLATTIIEADKGGDTDGKTNSDS